MNCADIEMRIQISKEQRTGVETACSPVRLVAFQSCFLCDIPVRLMRDFLFPFETRIVDAGKKMTLMNDI
jgi:hypothetical protein